MNWIWSLFLFTLFNTSFAIAAGPENIKWRGFANVGVGVSETADRYLDLIDENGSFVNDTSIGLNIHAVIDEHWSVQGQLFTHDDGDGVIGDWYFGKYKFANQSSLAVGKIKYSGNLISSYVDVGFAYPWVRPPQEIYGHNEIDAPMFLESFKGVQWDKSFGDEVTHTIRLLLGQAEEADEGIEQDKLVGVIYRLNSDVVEFFASYNRSENDFGEDNTDGANGKEYRMSATGGTVTLGKFKSYLEYVRTETEDQDTDTDAWFVTLSYELGKWVPHLTYAEIEQENTAIPNAEHSSVTAGVRYNLSARIALKFEYQQLDTQSTIFFEEVPNDNNIDILSAAINFVF